MTTVLLAVYLIIVIAMIGLILIQKSEGGGLGIGGGGGNNFMNARGTANLLTRTTGILAVGFFVVALSLAYISKPQTGSSSIFDGLETEGGDINLLEGLESLDRAPELPQLPQSQ